jgi:hypothetical protein
MSSNIHTMIVTTKAIEVRNFLYTAEQLGWIGV